jgi:hypothetical protein
MNTMEEAALQYLERGWSPIPAKPAEKRPQFAWKDFQTRRASQEEVHQWYKSVPNGNLSIVTGTISDLTVIDIDGEIGLHSLDANHIVLPPTLTVKTPHGHHFYYKYQGKPSTIAGLLDHVDVRGNGGCVCAPPSVTPSGTYTVIRDLPIAELGDVFDGLSQRKVSKFKPSSENWVTELLIHGATDGTRNDQAIRLAGYLKNKHPEDVFSAIMELWNDRNKPPINEDELHAIIHSADSYRESRSTFTMGDWNYFAPKQ